MSLIKIPAGTYFLGDPCYVIPDADWVPLLEDAEYFIGKAEGTTPSGIKVVAFGTAYGDGLYYDQYGNEFPVDAGLIGLVPMNRVDSFSARGCGAIVTFEADTTATSKNGGGLLHFGRHAIKTK